MKAVVGRAVSRCSPVVLAVVMLHVLWWLAGSPMSPLRHQLGRVRGRLSTMTGAAWALLVVSLILSVLYERRLQRQEDRKQVELKERAEEDVREKREDKRRFVERCHGLVQAHVDTLSRKREGLTRTDDYGVVDRSRWDQEKTYFVDRVLFAETDWLPDLDRVRKGLRSDRLTAGDLAEINEFIEEAVDAVERSVDFDA